MALEVVGRGQKIIVYRDPLWAPGRQQAVITLHDQHFEAGDGIYNKPVVESLVADGLDGYAVACDQMRHAIRYTEDGGRLWTPRRNLPKESIVIGSPHLLTSLGAKAEAYTLSALSLSTKTQALEWDVSGIKVVNEHNWRHSKTTFIIDKFRPTRFRWPITLNGGLAWNGWDIVAGDTVVARMLSPWAEDATGKRLPVMANLAGDYIEYSVDTAGAVFPVTVDPTFKDGYGGDVQTYMDSCILDAAPDSNWGVRTDFFTGRNVYDQITRGLIQFDISSIPGGATIDANGSKVYLYCSAEDSATDRDVRLHRGLTQWYEGNKNNDRPTVDGSTWNSANGYPWASQTAWAGGAGGASGSDWAASATATVTITGSGAWFNWDVTADISAFYAGTATNRGWWILNAVETAGSNSAKNFWASDYTTDATLRPYLTVDYTTGGGTTTLTPDPVTIPFTIPAPSLSHSLSLTPSPVTIPTAIPAPSMALSYGLAPDPVAIPLVIPAPTIALSYSLTPDPLALPLALPSPALSLLLGLAPDPVAIITVLPDPFVGNGQLVLSPSPVAIALALPDVALAMGAIAVTPDPVVIDMALPAANVGHLYTLSPNPVTIPLVVPAPVLSYAISLSPSPVAIVLVLTAGTIVGGGLLIRKATLIISDRGITSARISDRRRVGVTVLDS